MAYLALYRRFRPSGFDGLIGQEHIVRTLVNQIATDRIGHAYLFCGARGTGKTSCAKIFARAINCENPKNGSPCGECAACKALSDSANLDILEMDAASNNKVENVRDIRDKIQYPPVSGRYKVYIIDEVHMLTTEAFNALLKTLEEPPKHAVFILATTESHKLPATILSRCMRFDFRLIPTKKIAEHIAEIYDEIGKPYDKEAVSAIAAAGAGSIRDALSIADICVSYKNQKLTYNDVLEVLGATDSGKITETLKNVFASNTGKTLEAVEELSDSGKSVGVLCRDIIGRLRELIVCKTCEDARRILELPEDVYAELKEIADGVEESRLLRAIEIFSEAEGTLRYSATPRVVLETACIKASEPASDYDINSLLSRISKLEKIIAEGNFVAADRPVKAKTAEEKPVAKETQAAAKAEEIPAVDKKTAPVSGNFDDGYPDVPPEDDGYGFYGVPESKPAATEEPKETAPAAPHMPEVKSVSANRLWGMVVRKLREEKNMFLWVACQEMRAELKGRKLRIIASAEDDRGYAGVTREDSLKKLSEVVKSFGDYDVEVVQEKEADRGTEGNLDDIKGAFKGTHIKIED